MKMVFRVLCFALAMLVSFSAAAQKKEKPFAGIIKYSISYGDGIDAQTKAQLPTETNYYFKDGKVRSEQVSPMYTMSQIALENGSVIILIDVMGQKLATTQTKEDIDRIKAENADVLPADPKVTTVDEFKTICGYKCQKAEVADEEGNVVEVFFTNEIPVGDSFKEMNPVKGISGVAMEYSISTQGMSMTFTAKEVKKGGVNSSMFVIDDDYTKLPFEDFVNMLGGGM
ncbi:MAG: DUF4412 domain-containing protein [Bacteroidales bacterium]|nr:DUF4412 domain-containing protein [Bacteroidales bacterium]